jgi:DhnA family fructose-bisphosphate aldolase class Ia
VLRADVANVYSPEPPSEPFDLLIDDAIGLAVRHDAACVCLNLFDIPGQGALRGQCVDNIARVRTAADRAGMPVMVEPLPMNPGVGGYETDGDADRLVAIVRQATELGADVIKVDVTDDLAQYGRVVEAARVPLLARGGGRIDDTELLERTHAVLAQGAAGVVYGRNVIQHENPAAMVRALRALVHEGAGVGEALADLGVAAG